jgi:hypothetical protein
MDGRGSIPGKCNKFFYSPQRPFRPWSHKISYAMDTEGHFPPGVKRSGRLAYRWAACSSEIKNDGPVHPLPHTSSRGGA